MDVRQFRAGRVLDAVSQVRRAFFSAETEVRYLILEYKNIDHDEADTQSRMDPQHHKQFDVRFDFASRRGAALRLFNQRGKDIESATKTAITTLQKVASPEQTRDLQACFDQLHKEWSRGERGRTSRTLQSDLSTN